MGGSAVGGALARAILGDHASRPIIAARAYGLPAVDDARHDRALRVATRATPRRRSPATRPPARSARTRVVVTTGGQLAEQAARATACPVIPAAGGFQPRAAVGY